MNEHRRRPLLFLDVDGPLLPFGDGPPREPASTATDTHLARLDLRVGLRLAALPCELVWATTWEEAANTEIAPRLGLPPLPVVAWPQTSAAHEREDQWFGLHWKTRTLVAWADGRPFAWLDDEITDADRDWVATQHPASALVHRISSSCGLTDEDLVILGQWLRSTSESPQ
ncbi:MULTISPECIES: HAD domain-containing protein [unclassified Streptomyces]|uniref:HAD domain-containing protein n=1 Tax=unclassified Streptomyces TaxID=2593676 RepID=UPI00332D56D9